MPPRKRALSQASLAPFLAGDAPTPKRAAPRVSTEDAELEAALAASLADVQELATCPLCGGAFPTEAIQRHASGCGEDGGSPHPADADDGLKPEEPFSAALDDQLESRPLDEPSVRKDTGQPAQAPSPAPLAAKEDDPDETAFELGKHGDAHVSANDEFVEPETGLVKTEPDEAQSKPSTDTQPSFFSRLFSRSKDDAPVSSTKTSRGTPRRAPFYKILEGMPIAVDAFSYGAIDGCVAYILTHFHADHYGGLTARWSHGPIYCSSPTARLVCTKLGVPSEWVHALPMDIPTPIPGTGVTVTCIDANHCPGACIMLFEGRQTTRPDAPMRTYRYLHCGDFRACPKQLQHPALQQGVDIVYLDTTYLNPRYCFPAQPQVIDACTDLVVAARCGQAAPARQPALSWKAPTPARPSSSDLLVIVGTYSIGKEKLVLALARTLDTAVYCIDARKYATYSQLEDPELDARLTRDPLQARVHVTNLFALAPATLRAWSEKLRAQGMSISQTLAFRPTGWSFRGTDKGIGPDIPLATQLPKLVPRAFDRHALSPTRDSTADTQVYSVPYSEHSSFYELTAFMTSLYHQRTIPTVNVGSEASRTKMRRWTDVWTRAARRRAESPLIQPRSEFYW